MGVLMEPIEKHGAGDLVCACYDVVDSDSLDAQRHLHTDTVLYIVCVELLKSSFIISVHPRLGVRCSEERAMSTLIAIEFQIELMELALQI